MVWGCMSSHGVGRLYIVGGTVKAMDYIEILQNKLLPTARDLLGNQSWIFQDDNAPCHRAKVVQKWLEDHTMNRMNWPGQSPDLNPIKHETQQLETRPGCEETQDESIRLGLESVVAIGAVLAQERKTKLTPRGTVT
ncbi:transposable element Tcb1 transposase [Trichonephila clavipes]|nr:transposable element Tcb1 transposase [Trichonephila clavipes]